jgi:hypothetical protein
LNRLHEDVGFAGYIPIEKLDERVELMARKSQELERGQTRLTKARSAKS